MVQENTHLRQGCELVAELREEVKSVSRELADLRLQTEMMQAQWLNKADQQNVAKTVLHSKLASDLQELRDMVVHMATKETVEQQELLSVVELCREEVHDMREYGTRLKRDIDGIMEHVTSTIAAMESTTAKPTKDT